MRKLNFTSLQAPCCYVADKTWPRTPGCPFSAHALKSADSSPLLCERGLGLSQNHGQVWSTGILPEDAGQARPEVEKPRFCSLLAARVAAFPQPCSCSLSALPSQNMLLIITKHNEQSEPAGGGALLKGLAGFSLEPPSSLEA